MKKINRHFAEVLNKYLGSGKDDQASLSRKIKVSHVSVHRWCKGEEPGRENLKKLSQVTGIPVHELLGLPNPPVFTQIKENDESVYSYFPLKGTIKKGVVEFEQQMMIFNGHGPEKDEGVPLISDWWKSRGWNPEKIIAFKVKGFISDRYRDGAMVWVEKDVPLKQIEDGDEILAVISGGKMALKRWRVSDSHGVMLDIADPNGVPLIPKAGVSVYGVVRAVLG
jgi:transcriptional regulator with XRE-family HTH domain